MTSRLDARTKILYGLGEIANAIKMVAFGLFTLFFYTTVMGLPGTWVGLASVLALVWDGAIDPYIGYASDKARFRFGRRHSFMLVGSLTMGLAFWAFWSPPRGLPPAALFAWLLVASLLVRTTTSVYGVPYYALGAELSEDYHARTSVSAIRGMLALVGTLAAAAISFVAFFPERPGLADPKLDYAGYPTMGLVFGGVMSAAGLIATLGTLSRRHSPPRAAVAGTPAAPLGLFAGFIQCLRTPSFRVLFTSFSLFFLGVVANSSLSLHYLTYYVQITASSAIMGFQVAFFGCGIVGVAFWLLVSRVAEKRVLYLLAALATAALMLGANFLLGEGRLLGTGNVRALTIGHGLAGFFGSVLWFMPGSMIADVADEDELATGRRREGAFFGLFFFGQQVAAGISSLVTGVSLDWYAGLVPGRVEQSGLTVHRIGVLYAILPAVLVLAAAGLILRYGLTQGRVARIQMRLEDRRSGASPS